MSGPLAIPVRHGPTRNSIHFFIHRLGALPGKKLPLSVAGGSVHVLGVRDGDADPGLVRAG